MKMKSKVLCTLLSSVMAFSTLAACGGSKGNPSTSAPSNGNGTSSVVPYDGSNVTVTFYHTMGQNLRDILDKYIPEFKAMYPNITISHTQIGAYDDLRKQISTELTGKKSPSLAYCYPDHVAHYNKSKRVLTLDDYISSDALVTKADGTTETMGYSETQLNDFVTTYLDEGRQFGDGKTYVLPFQKSTEVLYYNKTYFAENNYEVPTTWDDMEELCKKIKEKEPKSIPLGYDSESNWFITMCEQLNLSYTSATGKHFLFNTTDHVNFIKEISDWYDKGYITTEEIYGSYTSDLFTNLDKTKSSSYMCIGSSGGSSYQIPDKVKDPTTGLDVFPFEVGVAQIPQVDVNNPKVISQGPSLVIFKTNAQEQAAAWLFAKFLTTKVELQAEFSMTNGYAPVINSVEDNEVYQTFLDSADGYDNLQASCVKQCLNQKNALFVSPVFDGSAEAREQVGILLQNCLIKKDIGSKTDDAILKFIQNQFNDIIDELEFDYA